jgi:low temperature requirement protein LtrA
VTTEPRAQANEEVSPLELFFDLVFVFALSQLSHHLLDHLTARGAAETVVMLVGVFCVWSYTSFEATTLTLSRSYTRWMLLAVMGIGLFMNAAIPHAFADRALAFVIPLLVIQLGRPLLTGALVPEQVLRGHYRVILVWMLATAPLWIAGAAAPPEARLTWWSVAAVIDLVGTWWAHPLPGRVLTSQSLAFDAEHMVERCRLFLIIALGETVLLAGTALTDAPATLMTLVTGASALVTTVALWALYFGASDHLVDQLLESTGDPIHSGRMTMNGMVVVVAGLIALGVGNELVIAHPHDRTTLALVLLLFGGALLYLLTQTWYLIVVIGTRSLARLGGMAGLVLGGLVSLALPAYAAALVLVTALTGTVLAVLREGGRLNLVRR